MYYEFSAVCRGKSALRIHGTSEPRSAIKRLGMHPEALRGSTRQAETDYGELDDRLTPREGVRLKWSSKGLPRFLSPPNAT